MRDTQWCSQEEEGKVHLKEVLRRSRKSHFLFRLGSPELPSQSWRLQKVLHTSQVVREEGQGRNSASIERVLRPAVLMVLAWHSTAQRPENVEFHKKMPANTTCVPGPAHMHTAKTAPA